MTWFRIDDGFHSHPKVLRAGNTALGLWTRCGAWSSHYLTDGFIPVTIAQSFGSRADASALVTAGLWVKTDGGYRMHDFHDHNPTADEVREKRQVRADAGRRGGIASGIARRTKPEPNGEANASPPDEANGNPVPTRPEEVLTSSSVINGSRVPGVTDDDDDQRFYEVLSLVVDGKERDHPPTRNARAWRKVVLANTRLEDGQVIRAMLADGSSPQAIALFVLGHGDSTKVDRESKPWCDTSCPECDGTGFLFDADLDGCVPCPNR